MGKKIKYKFLNDAPVACFFCAVSIIFFVLDLIFKKWNLSSTLLLSPTVADGVNPFVMKNGKSIIQLIIYSFGYSDRLILFSNLIVVVFLGTKMEEYYGSVIIGIMMFVSVLFAGVLNACLCKESLSGCSQIIYMLIFLDLFISLSKRKISISDLFIIALFVAKECLEKKMDGMLGLTICVTGGLCGSLFAFLASPKARKTNRENKASAEWEKQKSEPKKPSYDSSEETVIGSIEL